MATYNGEQFVGEQLRSILHQLANDDEIVIVDDASIDMTVSCIRSLNDRRIRLIESKVNTGCLAAFETAIRSASGDLIFLSDHDDIWEPNKVEVTLKALKDKPEARLVVSDASLIDEAGVLLQNSYYHQRGSFNDGLLANFSHCKYLGCVMAFRSTLIPEIVPFPKGLDVLHDIWIGMRNKLSGGKTCFIDQPLVRYRRHRSNVTGNERLSKFRQFRTRLHLVLALARFPAHS